MPIQNAGYLGDFVAGAVIRFKITASNSSGPAVIGGGGLIVRVYRDDNQTETAAGLSFVAGFDGQFGMYHIEIDTSADPTFYLEGSEYSVVAQGGQINISNEAVAGYVLGSFSIARATPVAATLVTIKTQTDKIGAGNIIVLDPVINGNFRIVQGDSYVDTAQGRALIFPQLSGANWPDDLAAGGWSVKLKANRRADISSGDASLGPITGTIVDAKNVRFELTAADTDGLATGNACYEFQIQAEKGSDRATLVSGTMTVTKDQNTA